MKNIIQHLIQSVFDFYLLDWVGMLCQFTGIFLLARKQKYGFLVFAIGNISWIGYAVITGSIAQIIANGVVACMNLYGFLQWK